jgi:LytS/YehU family sensor histidine kinase
VVIKLPIISAEIKQMAADNLARARLTFTISYATVREVIPLIGFAFLIRSLQQDEQMKTLKEQQLLSELTYLKAQLHPHFFFNTMNNIYSLALKQSKHTAPVVAKLADMMRYVLYEADQPKVSPLKEIVFLSNYVEVERIRHQQNTIRFDVQGANDAVSIEPLLMLPFIENAFKHGLEQETEQGFVNIILCIIDNELTLEVSNSKPQQLNPSPGIGLQNVIKRLALLYPGRHDLRVNEEADTYHVTLTLQLV